MKSYFIIGLTLAFSFACSLVFAQEKLSVERIWKKYEFAAKGFPAFKGMKDGLHFSKIVESNTGQSILKLKYTDLLGKGEVLVHENELKYQGKQLSVEDYVFNADETKLLLIQQTTPIYRRSFTAEYFILDLKTKKVSPLDETKNGCSLADFSPDGTQIAYLFENNIYVKNLQTNSVKQITHDGKRNEIINGGTDWVYEEEFAITKAFSWSSDSKVLAFLRFDESQVREFQLTYYGDLYPEIYQYKYPKAGEANSKVTAHLAYVENNTTVALDLGEYEYIPRLQWSESQNDLILITLNRHQNHVKYHLLAAGTNSLKTKVIFEEKSDSYVEVDDNLLILQDGKSILRSSEASGFMHIYKVGFDGSNTAITTGNFDVIEFLGLDEKTKTIYYTAAEKSPIDKGVYAIGLNGKGKRALTLETGYNTAEFLPGMNYFVNYYSDANTPNLVQLVSNKGKVIQVLEKNASLVQKMKSLSLSKKEFFQIDGEEGKLNAWKILPPNFDPTKKYPVYINIYGGPGSNMVLNRFGGMDYFYHQLLAQNGYIVVSVDPRGTMYRGAKFKKSTYLQLGKLECEDFIAVAKNLGKLDYVDATRIGIQGWSYGGFMSSLAMAKGGNTFKMGIAVAPVTNWRYYDNIYTERFMRTPQENEKGYDENSPINFVKDIQGKYFIIHGSGDDNVHYQNTMEMIEAMNKANIQFDMFIYPNKNHGIYGGNTRNHLFTMLFNYTLQNL